MTNSNCCNAFMYEGNALAPNLNGYTCSACKKPCLYTREDIMKCIRKSNEEQKSVVDAYPLTPTPCQ